MKRLLPILILLLSNLVAQNMWINEFHYDNKGTDVGEFIEIVVPAGFADITNVSVELYNGASTVRAPYNTIQLNSSYFVSTAQGFDFYVINFPSNGIQNGNQNNTEPDGIALIYNGTVIEFISYEGTFTAVSGTAAGMTSVDIGVSENNNTTLVGYSLQRIGSGTQASDFTWSGPSPETKGAPNTDQSLPVNLKTLYSRIAQNKVNLIWITASETNNAGFEIYRKSAGQNDFTMVDSYTKNPALKGKVNSSSEVKYQWTDPYVIPGKSYTYQLVDVSFSGEKTLLGELDVKVPVISEEFQYSANVPETFEVFQNYPNPFNPTTHIRIRIPELNDSHGGIYIFNLSGQLVKTLYEGSFAAGEYIFNWNADDNSGQPLASGVYIALVKAGQYQQSIKMTYIK